MRFRSAVVAALLGALLCAGLPSAPARAQGATPYQRLEVVRQRLESQRRALATAVTNLGGEEQQKKKDEKKGAANAQTDAAARLSGLEKEAGQLLSEVGDLRSRMEHSERFEASDIDKLEKATTDLNDRVETALRETAGERRAGAVATAKHANQQKKGGLFSHLNPFHGGSGDSEIDQLTATTAPGRDRELFAAGAKHARKGDYEGARLLFSVIINTYPESPFLPYAKLAVADTFYLEGTTSGLIQAGAAYQDWLTYFPTDPLAERAMLKIAESEMRQMGLPDRSMEHARKAEQRLKAALQQFPQTALRPDFETRLRETQEILAEHSRGVGDFYRDRYERGLAPNPKGAQSRYLEVYEKYKNYSKMADVLFFLGRTYVQEEEPDEAAKIFQQLVREHPNSKWVDKAKEQLQAIGAPVPEPDPEALKQPEPETPGFMQRFKQEALGSVDMTVDKDGVLISHDSKETEDLIDRVLANNGALPANELNGPTPSPRINLKPRPQPTPPPAQKGNGDGVKGEPTKPTQPATGGDPNKTPPPVE